ncbi:DUF5060 domain-containing protein [Haloferula sp. A504]|uniref:DUF5060 domain-containing protein n=1 Tax=Haloferula sp. A504 TaxID=3373601 RepID=UPI0031CAFC4E|nr:DUF5060 domain-containing protein [Verrucomicrobiaceae bacterium E54]
MRKFALTVMLAALPATAAEVNTVFEAAFESSKVRGNPFLEVEVDVFFSKDGREWKVPAFWDGGKTWKVRFAAPEEGEYRYRALRRLPGDLDPRR